MSAAQPSMENGSSPQTPPGAPRPGTPARPRPATGHPARRAAPGAAPAAAPPSAAAPAAPEPPVVFGDTAGISAEDQKEILGEIEKIATESRIQVSDEIFTVRPRHRGTVFPVAINLFFLALLAAGIAAFGRIFGAEERSLTQEASAFATTEGRLIEELKKESQEKLQEKDQQISQIEERLSRLDQERRDIELTMNTRIQDRERELRAALESELATERERLRGQGVSEADIDARLRTLEAQKSQEYASRLAAFRAQAEDERRKAEENMRVLQAEYGRSLQSLTAERDRLAQDAKSREAELRSQLEASTRSLEREKSAVEQRLASISEERQKEQLVASQLNGFYGGVRDQLRGARYDQALKSLADIRAYLNEDGIAQLPAVAARRDVELFVIDSLTRLVEVQKSQEATDTSSLVAQASLITELRQTVASADAAAARRDLPEAERLYRRAIAIVPDIEKSYAYLSSARDRSESDRSARVDGLLAQAEAAFTQGQQERALGFYRQALEALPADPAARDRMIARIQATGAAQGEARQPMDGAAAAASLEQGRTLLGEARYPEAVGAYLEVLMRQPTQAQSREAVDGINRAVARQKQPAAPGAAVEEQLAARLREIESLKRDLEDRDARNRDAQKQIAELQASLEALKASASPDSRALAAERDQARAERDRLHADVDSLNGELATLRDQLEEARQKALAAGTGPGSETASREEMQRLLRIDKSFQDLQQSYRQYAASEDRILKSQGPAGLLESKLKLDAFLTSDMMESAFPGLFNRIKKYDRAFQDVGRDVAIQDLSDVVGRLTRLDSADARLAELDRRIKASSADAPMVELLNELKSLIR
jgi:hypothetical protein